MQKENLGGSIMKLRRTLLTLLVLCLTVGALMLNASAADVIASGTCGYNLTWTLDDEGTLTISGTGEMYNFNTSDQWAPWRSYAFQINRVKVNEGVTSIGYNAFFSCDSLTSVEFPESLTSIGNVAFYSCDSLTSVDLSNTGVTSIEYCAFQQCHSLTSVTFPDSLTSIRYSAFFSCDSLTSV